MYTAEEIYDLGVNRNLSKAKAKMLAEAYSYYFYNSIEVDLGAIFLMSSEHEKNYAQIASGLLQKGVMIVLYKLKEEFFVEHKITEHQWKRRKEDLLEWLKNYYVYEIINGNPIMIDIKEVIGDYQPLPRKKIDHEELEGQKRNDYEEFTIASLGEEYMPNSKAYIAREAIFSFGEEKYGHTNYEYAANAFYKQESGQDISKEKNALKRIRSIYHDTPVLVEEWRSKG